MRILSAAGQTERYYLDGGFVQVVGNVVSVLTARAIPATEIDPGIAAEHLRMAHAEVANSDVLFEQRDRLEAQCGPNCGWLVTPNRSGSSRLWLSSMRPIALGSVGPTVKRETNCDVSSAWARRSVLIAAKYRGRPKTARCIFATPIHRSRANKICRRSAAAVQTIPRVTADHFS